MHVVKEGDHGKAGCPFDKKIVSMTYKTCDVPTSSGKKVVSGVLAGVCDECGKVIAIPQQSAIRVREQLAEKRKSLEARLPVHLVDVFQSSCSELGGPNHWKELEIPILGYYVRWLASERNSKRIVAKWLQSSFAKGKQSDRISAKVDVELYSTIHALTQDLNLSMSDLLKALILQMNADILEDKKNKRAMELEKAIETLIGAH